MKPHHKRKLLKIKPAAWDKVLYAAVSPDKVGNGKAGMSAVERSGHPTHSSPDPDDTDNPFNPPVKL